MTKHTLAVLEDALRARNLDRTLTTALPPGKGDGCVASTALAGLDAGLYPTAHACAAGAPGVGGGLPRGQLSEIAGPRSSGRTTLLLQVVAAATRRGEMAALVDTFDRLDLASVISAGVDLDRLLWIRGESGAWGPSPAAYSMFDRTIERALKALNLVLRAGGFGVVALDLADAPLPALNRIPFTTWLRVQRTIEGSDIACVLVGPQPLARSAGGLTLLLAGRTQWAGHADRSRRMAGLDVTVRVISPRRRVDGAVEVSALASDSR